AAEQELLREPETGRRRLLEQVVLQGVAVGPEDARALPLREAGEEVIRGELDEEELERPGGEARRAGCRRGVAARRPRVSTPARAGSLHPGPAPAEPRIDRDGAAARREREEEEGVEQRDRPVRHFPEAIEQRFLEELEQEG